MATTRIQFVLAILAWSIVGAASSWAADRVGIVLLHDKAESPADLAAVKDALTAADFVVATPEMCWARTRMYDARLADCLQAVEASVTKLAGEGVPRVLVAGKGIGARAALVFAQGHPGLAGVVVLGPVLDLSLLARQPDVAWRIAAARAATLYGQGNSRVRYVDRAADGWPINVNASSLAYLDFVDPAGPLALGAKLRKLGVPVLWVAGAGDYMTASRFANLFARNAGNRFVPADSGASGAGAASLPGLIADWLAPPPSQ
ncbi:MAG TPA: hypothetical protein VFB16_00610 [Bauldia sp.]|nr:hypothetical protein [Bauldia sp.]